MPSAGVNLRPEVFLRFETANKKSSLLGLEVAARNFEKAHSVELLGPTKIRRWLVNLTIPDSLSICISSPGMIVPPCAPTR